MAFLAFFDGVTTRHRTALCSLCFIPPSLQYRSLVVFGPRGFRCHFGTFDRCFRGAFRANVLPSPFRCFSRYFLESFIYKKQFHEKGINPKGESIISITPPYPGKITHAKYFKNVVVIKRFIGFYFNPSAIVIIILNKF